MTLPPGSPGAAGESLDQEILAGELERGQWVDLNGRQIAVVLPDSPTRILLSHDGGNTWRESVVEGSGVGYHLGRLWTDVHYADGFISLNEDGTGALVLATGVTMSRQDARCFLTRGQRRDGGRSRPIRRSASWSREWAIPLPGS